MSEDAVKLIGECSRDRLPSYVERLIVDVKQELGDSLTDYDLTVVILFALMAETGFTPLVVDDKLTGPMSPYGSTYDSQKLKAIQKMPKNWRAANGSSYSMKFHLNPCHDSVCQFLASKIEAGTNTVSIDDNLIVNLFVSCSPTAKAVHIQPSRYVASKSAPIPAMFDKLDELSLLFKNVVHPLRNTILEENGKLNASLVGIPTEVKLKIFQYLSVPAGWKALSETCMDMHILGNDPKLWKSYVKRDFGSIANHKASVEELCRTTKDVDWKTEYMGRLFRAREKRIAELWVANIDLLRTFARMDLEGWIQPPGADFLERAMWPPAGDFLQRGLRPPGADFLQRGLRPPGADFLERGLRPPGADFLQRGLRPPGADFLQRGLRPPGADFLQRGLRSPGADFLERGLRSPGADFLQRGLRPPGADFLQRGLRPPGADFLQRGLRPPGADFLQRGLRSPGADFLQRGLRPPGADFLERGPW